jgi:HEAT repeats
MLAPIDTLDWARYTHAYGSAADVPELLRGLVDADPALRERARYELYGNIFHQGSRYEASAVAAGFLVEFVDGDATPDRPLLLRLLVHLAIGYDASWLPEGLPIERLRAWLDANPPDLDGFGERYRDWMLRGDERDPLPGSEEERICLHAYWELDTYDQVRLGVPIYQRLLVEADRDTRVAAAYALAWFPEDGPDSLPYLAAAADDADPTVAATAIVALGLLGEEPPTNGLGDERALVRWATAIALAGRSGAPDAVTELRRWTAHDGADIPYLYGDVAEYARRSLEVVTPRG